MSANEANAVAGPSRTRNNDLQEPTVTPNVVRSATAVEIIPTFIDAADGLKQVPAAFQHCQVDDLITLIGSYTLIILN